MSRIIPNKQSFIGFTATAPANLDAPTEAEIDASTNLTPLVASITASSTGQPVPVPSLDSLYNSSITGTVDAQFSADLYRDDAADTAWDALPRGTRGYFFISRFGGTGTDMKPRSGQTCEVWPVQVTTRGASAMASGQVQTFTIQCGVPEEPSEDAVVTASSGVASVPRNLVGSAGATGIAVLDWDAPATNGGHAITGYKVYKCTTLGGSYVEVTTNITKVGTTATLTSLSSGAGNFFKVAATNSIGDSAQTAVGVMVTVAA